MTVVADADLAFREAFAARLSPTRRRWATPGEMAVELDPRTVQTPALELIDRALVDLADGKYKRLAVFMSPQEGKSERCSHYFPLWLLQQNPDLRIAIVSYSDDIARRWGWQLRLDIETYNGVNHDIDLGLRLYNRPAQGSWRIKDRRGGVFCVGIAGSLSGRPVDVLIIDDPIKDLEQAQSVKYRERAWRFWTAVAVPRMGPHTKTVLIQTRWHEDDLAGRLLQNEGDLAKGGKWKVISIPARCEDPKTDPLGRAEGEYMVSARGRTPEDWREREREVGAYVFAALFQQRPAPAEGGLFKRMWWRYWTPAGPGRLHLGGTVYALADCWRFATVDLAASQSTSADWTVISAWARTLHGDLVLLDRVRARIGEDEHFAHALPLVERWQLDTLFVEKSQYGYTLVREATQRGVPITPLDAERDKFSRALPASAWCSGGRVWLPAGAWWLDQWRDEHAGFPNGAHDDQVDTLAYAVRAAVTRWVSTGTGAASPTTVATAAQAAAAEPEPEVDPFPDQPPVTNFDSTPL